MASASCVCGHDEDDHDAAGCLGPANGRFCPCTEFALPAESTDGPETAAKAAALIEKRIY